MAEIMVPYTYDGRSFEGAIVYDETVATPRPAIFMQPDWYGVCRHSMDMAADASRGAYVMLLADMYGTGYGDRDRDEAELLRCARAARGDLAFVRGCGAAAEAALLAEADRHGLIDRDRIGAIGFCMGGGILLEQVRAGGDFRGSVVFHVTAPNPLDPAAPADFRGRVLAIHGAADPVTPKPMMDALEAELTAAGIDWQVTSYGHAVHSFCVEGANNPGRQMYDPVLCQRAYREMRAFFDDTF
jgi:dienelactone hydrolase